MKYKPYDLLIGQGVIYIVIKCYNRKTYVRYEYANGVIPLKTRVFSKLTKLYCDIFNE